MDTMTEQDVIDLMKTSKNEDEWKANCGRVKAACNGYPNFWWPAVMESGVAQKVMASWK